MTIYLVRHGKDNETIGGRWSNHGLMPVGVEQVNKLAKEMVAANMKHYNKEAYYGNLQ